MFFNGEDWQIDKDTDAIPVWNFEGSEDWHWVLPNHTIIRRLSNSEIDRMVEHEMYERID